MSLKVKTNFGAIHGRRCITFKVTGDGLVVPAKFRNHDWDESDAISELGATGELITAHESFKRWKASRKAWKTRRARQLLLSLQ